MTKTSEITLSIIIVSYNTADLTTQTLSSIQTSLENSPHLKNKTEIFVVDNKSTDDSLKKIKPFKKIFKNLTIIENQTNNGFSKANNQAAKQASGKYLLLLNSDTIIQADALDKLVKQANKYKLQIAAAQLLNQDQSIQPQGGNLPTLITVFNHYLFLDDLPLIGKFFSSTQHTGINFSNHKKENIKNKDRVQKIDWVGGTAMLINHQLWKKIGPLDENIFMYGEDIELCLRAHQAKAKIGIITSAQVVHLGSSSSSSKNALLGEIKGYQYIWQKHKPSWQFPLLKIILIKGIILRIILFGIILRTKKGKIYLEILQKILTKSEKANQEILS